MSSKILRRPKTGLETASHKFADTRLNMHHCLAQIVTAPAADVRVAVPDGHSLSYRDGYLRLGVSDPAAEQRFYEADPSRRVWHTGRLTSEMLMSGIIALSETVTGQVPPEGAERIHQFRSCKEMELPESLCLWAVIG